MTQTLPADLGHCYSLLFTGDAEQKNDNHLKSILCYEECRMTAEQLITKNNMFAYALFRSARKEAQSLILMGFEKRAYRMLKKLHEKQLTGGNQYDHLFITTHLMQLSFKYEPKKFDYFKKIFDGA